MESKPLIIRLNGEVIPHTSDLAPVFLRASIYFAKCRIARSQELLDKIQKIKKETANES